MFLVINSVMIALLIKEATDAYYIPHDQKILYEVYIERKLLFFWSQSFLMNSSMYT